MVELPGGFAVEALKNTGLVVGVAGPYPQDDAPQLIARSSREARAFAAAVDVL